MKIKVKIHPNSSQEKVQKKGNKYEVWLKEKPINNKANFKLVKILSRFFKSKARISSGFSSRNKIIEIE